MNTFTFNTTTTNKATAEKGRSQEENVLRRQTGQQKVLVETIIENKDWDKILSKILLWEEEDTIIHSNRNTSIDEHQHHCKKKFLVMQKFEFKDNTPRNMDPYGSMTRKRSGTLLHAACCLNAPIDVVSTLIEKGGKDLVMEKNIWGENALHYACSNANNNASSSIDIVSKLIEVGGRELVLDKDDHGYNSFHYASEKYASVGILSILLNLIEVGGKELVMDKNKHGHNSLMVACKYNNTSLELVSELINVGGTELVMERNCGWTSLHYACRHKASIDVVSKIIEVGGKELIFAKNANGWNALHYACMYPASMDVVSKLIEVGGRALVMETDNWGKNSLHIVCIEAIDEGNPLLDERLITLLTQHEGASTVLTQTNDEGKTPLYYFIANGIKPENWWTQREKETFSRRVRNYAAMLINKGIELQVEGEYGIGGLFLSTSTPTMKYHLYKNWDIIVLPILEQVMTLPHNRHLPILQALIANNAPTKIIKSTMDSLPDSNNIADSLGMYPIDLAVRHRLDWKYGMRDIVEAFASVQQTSTLHVCAKHGVEWENGTKEVVGSSDACLVEGEDVSTGLFPFMIAAVRESYGYDFDSIFHLIKASPKLVQRFGCNRGEEQHSRKRKRQVPN